LYWEPANIGASGASNLIQRHRQEIDEFAELVAGDDTCELIARRGAEQPVPVIG
jgi:hypothetical protein